MELSFAIHKLMKICKILCSQCFSKFLNDLKFSIQLLLVLAIIISFSCFRPDRLMAMVIVMVMGKNFMLATELGLNLVTIVKEEVNQ